MWFREAVGRRVVDRSTAGRIGTVKRFLVDPPSATVVALEIGGGRAGRTIVDWPALVGFGPDAVVVPDADTLREPEGDLEREFVDGRFDVDGKRILSADGDELGAIQDVEFDERSGQLVALETGEGRRIPVRQVVSIGPYAVILPAASG